MLCTTFMLFCGIMPLHSVNGHGLPFPHQFWQSAAPGSLLETLDLMTSDAIPIYAALSPPKTTTPKTVVLREKAAPREKASVQSKEDDSSASDSEESSNYDRAYEQFVRNYFHKRRSQASKEEASASSAEPLNLDIENSASTEIEQKNTKHQHCKKIRKQKQYCVICRHPRNNEKSETCAYSTETKPLQYAYEEQKNYKTSRKSPVEEDSSETEKVSGSEQSSSEGTRAKSTSTPLVKKSSQIPAETSSCVKTTHAHRICYHCENVERGNFTKCYAKYEGQSDSKSQIKGKGHQVQQRKQRIHKRTISYSFFNKKGY